MIRISAIIAYKRTTRLRLIQKLQKLSFPIIEMKIQKAQANETTIDLATITTSTSSYSTASSTGKLTKGIDIHCILYCILYSPSNFDPKYRLRHNV